MSNVDEECKHAAIEVEHLKMVSPNMVREEEEARHSKPKEAPKKRKRRNP